MKKVIIELSVKPRFFCLVAMGKKTLELRKSYPKEVDESNVDIDVLLYCGSIKSLNLKDYVALHAMTGGRIDQWQGKISARFKLKKVYVSEYVDNNPAPNSDWSTNECSYHKDLFRVNLPKLAGVTVEEAEKYAGKKPLYLWQIDNLKVLDKPKELTEIGLKRPAESWRYMSVYDDTLQPTPLEMEDFWLNK